MPRITCIERTRQTIRIAHAELTEWREDGCDTRQYKLFAVQSLDGMAGRTYRQPRRHRLAASNWRDQLKESSLTANTDFLAALADPQLSPGFRLLRTGKLDGRAVSVYAFSVATPEGYLLFDTQGSVRVPFQGRLYTDAATSALVRMAIQCHRIPRQSEYDGAEVQVDFGSFDVATGWQISASTRKSASAMKPCRMKTKASAEVRLG